MRSANGFLSGDEFSDFDSVNMARRTSRSRRKKTSSRRKVHRKSSRKSRKSRRSGTRYTKNGQPYIILASGKARFIKGKRRKR